MLSIVIAVSGTGLSFWLMFKHKISIQHKFIFKLLASVACAFSIVGMHYTGMAAANLQLFDDAVPLLALEGSTQGALLFIIIFITCLVLIAIFAVAILELRLEERNHQLFLATRELENLVLLDNLTKLPNRLYLVDYSKYLFTDSRLYNQKVAFLYIDIDHFKSVNEAFGHQVGDLLLIGIAQRMQNYLKLNQKLLRIGGDEFLLILENTSLLEATQIAETVLLSVQESFAIQEKDINISASIGIVMYPEHGSNLQDLLINADSAMHLAKEQGRNSYYVFNHSIDQQEIKSQSKLINDLYKAVEEKQFVLFYQPKFTLDGRISGVEALIRWNHPSLGLLPPGMFIDGAEKTGLIIRMGYWALEEACKQIRSWRDKKLPFFPIAVNLSAIQFEHKQLLPTLQRLIAEYEIEASDLIIEITESTVMHHIDKSIQTFEKLRELGIRLAIDDFGTGHSSFLYLKDLPVDELKIDREFIKDLTSNSKEEAILQSIIQLAKKLGLTVTAEGVETQLQADILGHLGCLQLQGFLLGRPVPVAQLEIEHAHLLLS
mgnify:FL=1